MTRAVVSESANHAASGTSSKYFTLAILVAASILVWWQPLSATARLALGSDAHTFMLLIVPLSVVLIYAERKRIPSMASWRGWLGWTLLSVAFLLRALTALGTSSANPDVVLPLSMCALVLWWIGSVLVCCGLGTFRALQFPLCFLFLLVPAPTGVVDWIRQTLQYQSAFATEVLFHMVRVPVTRDGLILSIPGLDIEVATQCSSIRSSTMLVVTTLLIAHLFLHSNWRKVLLVAASIPFAVAKNAVRIFTIAELGTRVDPAYLDGKIHHSGGILFLAVGVVMIVILLWILRRGDVRRSETQAQ
jgi:exosortase